MPLDTTLENDVAPYMSRGNALAVDAEPRNPHQCNGEPLRASPSAAKKEYVYNLYLESYGCQMNFADSEIVSSILEQSGYQINHDIEEADLILINTCSIREKAELTIRKRLEALRLLKASKPSLLIGILGCMAERLKQTLLEQEQIVDVVVGPDAYRSLPQLLSQAREGHRSVNVLLSREETYADIAPIRLDTNGVSAYVSIMRGCNNMCSFCVVPFTRGRERSRPYTSIVEECKMLVDKGYKEVTLLGQNVDSYAYTEAGWTTNFASLLRYVAEVDSSLRVRFSTSHPKDITDEVLHTMQAYSNICKYIHLPVQSGSTRILSLMNRTYTREWYLDRVSRIKHIVPACGMSTDIITGFCTESEADHQDTLSLMQLCQFDYAYMFAYSERPNTPAAKRLQDDVPALIKKRRLQEIVALQRGHSLLRMQARVGESVRVLIEGDSKKSTLQWMGRTDQNQVAIFDKHAAYAKGDYVDVHIHACNSATLQAAIIE